MADVEAARKAILDHILFVLRVVEMPVGEQAKAVNDLAEAWARLENPNQPHGGRAQAPKARLYSAGRRSGGAGWARRKRGVGRLPVIPSRCK